MASTSISQMSNSANHQLRSLYRSLLRELPSPTSPSTTSSTSASTITPKPSTLRSTPLRASIRTHFAQPRSIASDQNPSSQSARDPALEQRQQMEQYLIYLRSQRIYGQLLERYNPGMGMDEDQRVRLTARRVGMDMPEEWYGKVEGFGNGWEERERGEGLRRMACTRGRVLKLTDARSEPQRKF